MEKVQAENVRLHGIEKDYVRLRRGLGDDKANEIIDAVKTQELTKKKPAKERDYAR